MTEFALKPQKQSDLVLTPQHKKLRKLIDQIEHQKQNLELWKNAQTDIQSYIHLKLVPIYSDLDGVWFQQMQVLWQHLLEHKFSKSDLASIDNKLVQLSSRLVRSKTLHVSQIELANKIAQFYAQDALHHQTNAKKNSKKHQNISDLHNQNNPIEFEEASFDDWQDEQWDDVQSSEQFQRQREEHQRKRLEQKRIQAEKLVEQSLKTVYLKIASMIHPDREPDESIKIEKTELLQRVNEAYEQEDLFFLLKLQIEIEQTKNASNKGLSIEQEKFYLQALEAQSQTLQSQIQEVIDSLVWSNNAKIAVQKSKGQLNIEQLYKQIDAEVSVVKQQLKAEKQRLTFMGKESGLVMLLEHGIL